MQLTQAVVVRSTLYASSLLRFHPRESKCQVHTRVHPRHGMSQYSSTDGMCFSDIVTTLLKKRGQQNVQFLGAWGCSSPFMATQTLLFFREKIRPLEDKSWVSCCCWSRHILLILGLSFLPGVKTKLQHSLISSPFIPTRLFVPCTPPHRSSKTNASFIGLFSFFSLLTAEEVSLRGPGAEQHLFLWAAFRSSFQLIPGNTMDCGDISSPCI